MLEPERKLRHLPFFEELARLQEGDARWRAVTAGLVVLRLVDAWVDDGTESRTDLWAVRAVRGAIEEVAADQPVRAILTSVIEALAAGPPGDLHAVVPRLMAYARTLDQEGHFALAVDVYRTVVAYTHPVHDSEVAIAAHLQLGRCLRSEGDISASETAYRTAGQLAARADDIMSVLLARLGEAKAAFARGNLPRAEQLLDDTIAASGSDRLRRVRSMALHDRAGVAYSRGDYPLTVKLAYDALDLAEDLVARDRILGDIAATFVQLGALSAARDAYTILAVTARQQWVRWMSTLNLLDIAAREGAQPLFERYRRQLSGEKLPPSIETSFELFMGQGYARFGRVDFAHAHLARAVALAEQHGLNRELFEAESSLQSLAGAAPAASRAGDTIFLSPEVRVVADGVRGLRAHVGAAAWP